MAPSRPAPSLVVRTPRHASRRVRPALAAEIKRIAKQHKSAPVDLDGKLVVNDPTHPLGMASDNASEWNSLLITARAERGPQWDVATQRFMVDYGSHLYFDSTTLAFPDEPTPPPDESSAGRPPSDLSALWQDPRFAHYNGGGGGSGSAIMSNISTPPRTSLRLQHQQHQQLQLQQQQQLPHQQLNGHGHGNGMGVGMGIGMGIGMGNAYPYGLTNGRTPEQQHYAQAQAQVQVPHSYYDGSQIQGQSQTPSHGQSPNHALPNGISLSGAGTPSMLGRQMGMGSGIGMGMEFGGGGMGGAPDTPSPDVRRRTRSQQEGHMEIGW